MAGPMKRNVSFKLPPTAGADPLRLRQEGIRLWSAGDKAGADRAFSRYLAAPTTVPVLQQAEAARARHDLAAADRLIRGALKQAPGDPVALRLLGQIALTAGNAVAAEQAFRRVLTLAPSFAPARGELAAALLTQGRTGAALAETGRLLAATPNAVPVRVLHAQALLASGDAAGAAATGAALVAEHSQEARLWLPYALALRMLRRHDDAVAALRRAIAVRESFGEAWWQLANLKTGAIDAADLARLPALIAGAKGEDGYHLRFALARGLEDAGRPEEAMAAYREANAARRAMLPPDGAAQVAEQARRTRAVFTPAMLAKRAGLGDPSPAPIFILGLPRSGSTLLEQMLSCHPAIEGTQELPDLPLLVASLAGLGGGAGGYPELLATLPDARLAELGAAYLKSVAAKRTTDKPFFTDKQPANWMHAGLIRLILPNAKIIDMRRDPFACGLSIFRQHFARGAGWSYAIETIAARQHLYAGRMDHWAEAMPGAILPVTLEALVDDPAATLRRVLDHLGLPFDPAVLDFHRSDRPVFTPSSEQVRQPINREGEVRVAALAPFADDLRAALAAAG